MVLRKHALIDTKQLVLHFIFLCTASEQLQLQQQEVTGSMSDDAPQTKKRNATDRGKGIQHSTVLKSAVTDASTEMIIDFKFTVYNVYNVLILLFPLFCLCHNEIFCNGCENFIYTIIKTIKYQNSNPPDFSPSANQDHKTKLKNK